MKTRHRFRAVISMGLGLLLSGCIALPLPKKADPPRYSEDEIRTMQTQFKTRSDVQEALGDPDISRDRVWVYAWTVQRGQWLAIAPLMGAMGTVGSVSAQNGMLFFDFGADGTLIHQEVATNDEGPVCNTEGVCVEHKAHVVRGSGEEAFRYMNAISAVSLQLPARDQLPRGEPTADSCVVVLWPRREDWDRSILNSDQDGLAIGFGSPGDVQAAVSEWLPIGVYGEWRIPVGDRVVLYDATFSDRTLSPYRSHEDPEGYYRDAFQCRAGERIHFEIAARSTPGRMLHGMRLQPRTSQEAESTMTKMRRLVPFNPVDVTL